MKKLLFMPIVILIISLSACASESGKVNVIKGPGSANNSHMVSFNELCSGEVEGFLGGSDRVLVSRKTDNGYAFSLVNSTSKEWDTLLFTQTGKDYSLEICRDGSKILLNNLLVDIESKETEMLPDVESFTLSKPDDFPVPLSWSFIRDSEVVLTDPFYYVMKFYSLTGETETINLNQSFSRIKFKSIGDLKPKQGVEKDFSGIRRPNITYLKNPSLLLDELKYVFIGYAQNTGNTPLYVLDLFEKEFKLIDDNVKAYSLSPDRKQLAYIKTDENSSGWDVIYTVNIDGMDKRELVRLPYVSGLAWSQNSSWIAYSGGERAKCDISIIKSDGTRKEQLTNGMNSTDKLAWSRPGDKIAFTSGTEESSAESKVYIIKLNIEDSSYAINNIQQNEEKTALRILLEETLRKETSSKIEKEKIKG